MHDLRQTIPWTHMDQHDSHCPPSGFQGRGPLPESKQPEKDPPEQQRRWSNASLRYPMLAFLIFQRSGAREEPRSGSHWGHQRHLHSVNGK